MLTASAGVRVSVCVCRIALRCATALEKDAIISILPAGAQDAAAQMRATVIARGRPKIAAEVSARGKPQGVNEAQALSPFAVSTSSSSERNKKRPQAPPAAATSSVGDAAWELHSHLVSSSNVLTPQSVLKLLCTAGSPGEQQQQYDLALSQGLFVMLEELRYKVIKLENMPAWLVAAIQHAELYDTAEEMGGSDIEMLVLGRGATEAAYIR
jgi:hypothetical protein